MPTAWGEGETRCGFWSLGVELGGLLNERRGVKVKRASGKARWRAESVVGGLEVAEGGLGATKVG